MKNTNLSVLQIGFAGILVLLFFSGYSLNFIAEENINTNYAYKSINKSGITDCPCSKLYYGCVGEYKSLLINGSWSSDVSLTISSDNTYSLYDGDDFYFGEWEKDGGDAILYDENGKYYTVFDCNNGLINVPSVGRCKMTRQ